MKQEIQPAKGRLGILLVGLGGAVSSTAVVGTLAVRKGLAKPIGSITQLATIRLGKRNENRFPKIKDVVPLADLNDLVFGGWDIFEDDVYAAAQHAEVLVQKDLDGVKEELQAIKPMKAAFDQNWVKRLHGTHVKQAATRWEMAEQIRQDIRDFKAANNCDRVVVIWAASTEIYIPLCDEHQSLAAFEKAMKENNTEKIAPSMCYAYAAIAEGAPYIMGAPKRKSLQVCVMLTLLLPKVLLILWVLLTCVLTCLLCGSLLHKKMCLSAVRTSKPARLC